MALKDISAAHHSTGGDIALVLGLDAIMFLLAEIPLIGLIADPSATEKLVERVDGWFSRNGRRIATALCLILGIFLISRGIAKS